MEIKRRRQFHEGIRVHLEIPNCVVRVKRIVNFLIKSYKNIILPLVHLEFAISPCYSNNILIFFFSLDRGRRGGPGTIKVKKKKKKKTKIKGVNVQHNSLLFNIMNS